MKSLISAALWALIASQILVLIMMPGEAAAQFESNRDLDEEGSGSGDSSSGGCIPPTRADFPNIAQRDVINEIRCHLACIDKVKETRNVELQVSRRYPLWPMILDETLEEDCSVYQQVQECKEGCTAMAGASLSTSACARRCVNRCTSACEGESSCQLNDTVCSRQCDRSSCELGCEVFSELVQTEGEFPPAPPRAPQLVELPVHTNGAWRFRVDPGNTSLAYSSKEQGRLQITSFLFRVHQTTQGIITYYWLRSLDDVLNLEAFECLTDVMVQYYAVNKFGDSHRSSTQSVDLVLSTPEHPDDNSIVVRQDPDERPGYWKHAVLHISWHNPRGYNMLDGYVVTVLPPPNSTNTNCGTTGFTTNTSVGVTSVEFQAPGPEEGLLNGCMYNVTVSSILASDFQLPAPPVIPIQIQVNNPVPINFQCQRSFDEQEGKFRFSVTWSIPSFAALLSSIGGFVVSTTVVTPQDESRRLVATAPLGFDASNLMYDATLGPVDYRADSEAYFNIQLETLPVGGSGNGPSLVPDPVSCSYPTVALPPQPVASILVDSETTRYREVMPGSDLVELEVGVAWTRPQGRILGYEVRVVEIETSTDNGAGEIFASQRVNVAEQTELIFVATVPIDMPSGSCFYVQVRSVSPFMAYSNWSDAQCIEAMALSAGNLTTNVTTDDTVDTGKPKATSSVTIVYLVVGLGVGMLVIMSMLLMFMALALLHQRQKMVSTMERQPASLHKKLPQGSAFSSLLSQQFTSGGSTSSDSFPSPGTSPLKPPLSPQDWELHPSQVLVEARLGHGMFGDVFRGMVRGGVGLYKSKGPVCLNGVAIKLLKTTSNSAAEKEAFLGHIEQAKQVTRQIYSPHLVRMLGCVTSYDPYCLVMELPVNGDLLSYLVTSRRMMFGEMKHYNETEQIMEKESGENQSEQSTDNMGGRPQGHNSRENGGGEREGVGKTHLTAKELLTYASEIASGLENLSMIGVVHGDIACRNIFLDQHKHAKITDFSLNTGDKSRGGSRTYVHTETGRMPVKWMAPETLADGHFSMASDMWALGVTIWEIVTLGGLPYNGIRNKDVLNHLTRGHRLEKPENCSQELYDMMRSCWDPDPTNRPSFKALKDALIDLTLSLNPSTPNSATDPSSPTPPITFNLNHNAICYQKIAHTKRKPRKQEVERGAVNEVEPGDKQKAKRQNREDTIIHNAGVHTTGGVTSDREESLEREGDDVNNTNTGKLPGLSHLPIIVEDEEEEEEDDDGTYHNYLASPTSPSHQLLSTTNTGSDHVVVEMHSSEETSAEPESDSYEDKRTSESSLDSSPEPEGVQAGTGRGGANRKPHLFPAITRDMNCNGTVAVAVTGKGSHTPRLPSNGAISIPLDTIAEDTSSSDETLAQQDREQKALL